MKGRSSTPAFQRVSPCSRRDFRPTAWPSRSLAWLEESHALSQPGQARPKSLLLAHGDHPYAGRDEEQVLAFSRTKNMMCREHPA